jgi:monoamine oxidase
LFSVDVYAQPKEVIVVGAGVAGLTAAYELEQKGFVVTVLEARDRVGGRIGTLDMGEQHGEIGGELIDHVRVHTQVHHYANLFGVELADTGYWGSIEEGAYYFEGQLIPYGSLKNSLGLEAKQDMDRWWNELHNLGNLVPDASNPQLAPNAAELDQMTAQDWIDSLDLHPFAQWHAEHYCRAEFNDAQNMSLLFLAQQYKVYQDVSENESEILRFLHGGRDFANAFVNNIEGQVLLNHSVTQIKDRGDGVTVTAAQKKFEADYVVVTVPLTVLDRIHFVPALPTLKREAAENLSYGSHTKVLLQYSKRFWLDYGVGGDTVSDLQIGWTWESTERQGGDGGILISYSSGSYTDAQIQWTDGALIQNRLDQIEQMYPGSSEYFVDASVHAWHREEWTMGGWLVYSPGQVMKYWGAFLEPAGRVYFAGEHTDDEHIGFIEGAARSGQRVAKQIAGQ